MLLSAMTIGKVGCEESALNAKDCKMECANLFTQFWLIYYQLNMPPGGRVPSRVMNAGRAGASLGVPQQRDVFTLTSNEFAKNLLQTCFFFVPAVCCLLTDGENGNSTHFKLRIQQKELCKRGRGQGCFTKPPCARTIWIYFLQLSAKNAM